MHELLCTSPAVSPNNIFGTREGLGLPEVRRLINYKKRWEDTYDYPWDAIHREWMEYWNRSKQILLDKTPSSIIRIAGIEQSFQPVHFIAMSRNPYAHCESLIRRDGMDAAKAANFYIRCLKAQKENLNQAENILHITYEELTDSPDDTIIKMIEFLPELKKMNTKKIFKAHNYNGVRLPIKNLNTEKIEKLEPDQIDKINNQLSKDSGILAYFGYELIKR